MMMMVDAKLLLGNLLPSSSSRDKKNNKNLYLYHGTNDSYPVVEYILRGQSDDDHHNGDANANNADEAADNADPRHPAFLYGKDTPARVVEFYAPWCPHCQHFRKHYIELAHKINHLVNATTTTTTTTTNGDDNNNNNQQQQHLAIPFYAVSCTAHPKICQDIKVPGYPRVKLFKPGNATPVGDAYPPIHPFELLHKLGIQTDPMDDLEEDDNEQSQSRTSFFQTPSKQLHQRQQQKHHHHHHHRTKSQIFSDAYLSFDFALRHGVYMTEGDGPLTDRRVKRALRQFLLYLQKATPIAWKLQQVVSALLQNFDSITQSEENLLQLLDQYPPKTNEWSIGCTKEQPGMGYSCGLWTLFHIAAVGMLEWNLHAHTKDAVSANAAADTLRDFVSNFFGCDVCRTNFNKEYDSCSLDRCNRLKDAPFPQSWKQYPLWLLETHNAVNVRLMKEQAERDHRLPTTQDEIDKRWPSLEECPKCWKEDGTYDEEIILKHLRVVYWYVLFPQR